MCPGGMHAWGYVPRGASCPGACVPGGHACQVGVRTQSVCVAGGMHALGGVHAGGCAWHECPPPPKPRVMVGQCAAGTHSIGMHSFYLV